MILAQDEILRRLDDGDIFKKGSWCKTCLQEASYALRIANDGLLIDGEFHDPGEKYDGDYIKIEPGKIAILSTMELLNMPADLLGKIGIRLKYAHQGLTGLMGIQVDPLYGRDKPAERLYIRVANFGNETIQLSPGDQVFTFELHEVTGNVSAQGKEINLATDEGRFEIPIQLQLVLCNSGRAWSIRTNSEPKRISSAFGDVRGLLGVCHHIRGNCCHPTSDTRLDGSRRGDLVDRR